jgi:hypothetical protein
VLPWIVLGVAVLGALFVAYGVFVERRWYRLARHRLDILPAGGPAAIDVLHLSDLRRPDGATSRRSSPRCPDRTS